MKLQTRKLSNKKPTSTTAEALFSRIASPRKEDIQIYSFLRNTDNRESELFKNTKKQLDLVFWNTVFSDEGTTAKHVIGTTGYLFFDIDTPISSVNILKNNPHVHVFWRSCTGKGYGGLIKVKNLPKEVSPVLYRNIMTKAGLVDMVDPACSNVNRGNFISYDPNIRKNFNFKSLTIDVSEIVNKEYDFLKTSPKSKVRVVLKTEDLDVVYKDKVPFVLFSTKLEMEKSITWGKYELIKMFSTKQKYHEVNIYSKIKDGKRNTTLFATAHMIVWINRKNITISSLATVMRQLNNVRCDNPLPEEELLEICKKAMAKVNEKPVENKEFRFLFNTNANLSHEDKMKLIGQERVKINIQNFHDLLDTWDITEKYTRKKAAELIGLKPNTLTSWKTRFPELYLDADKKIKKLKEKHEELKNVSVEVLLSNSKAKAMTNANWDNTEHPQFKALKSKSDTIDYALKLRKSICQEEFEFNIDGFPLTYAKNKGLENVVFIDDSNKMLLVAVGNKTLWREDGLVVGIKAINFNIKSILVGKTDKLSFSEESFHDMINNPDLFLETNASWDNIKSKDYNMLLSINERLAEVTQKAKKLGHNKAYRVNFNGLTDKVREKAREEGMDTVVLWEEQDSGMLFTPISDNVSWFEDGTLVGVNVFEGFPVPIAAGKKLHK